MLIQNSNRSNTTDTVVQLLVVDDEKSVLSVVTRCFLDSPVHVVTADNAKTALEMLHNGLQVALVISDYRMPGMNGVEFLQQVMQNWPDIKRVILSAYPDTDLLLSAVNEGRVHYFVAKPWNSGELRSVVQELLKEVDVLKNVRQEVEELVHRNKLLASTNQQLTQLLNNLLQIVRGDDPDKAIKIPSPLPETVSLTAHQHLSPREYQILKALAAGQKPKEIAHDLGISVKTVSTYKLRMCEKMGFSSDAALISYALSNRIIPCR
ncbi:MAG: response regulator [Trichlorobacter sp.]|uniref:response regulator n=1 Tax=Trichlorobacter sp. TaxID=2911007 RepID=UPI002565621C|nr:response regulator [Trichlorobacter sp.]MDK9719356.1 response regulator [Trichlorobacter sp.]